MSNKVLSISIAAYNVAGYINKAIDSITSSGAIDDIEIIVVNDGSKDETSRLARELQEQWPESIVVVDKENGGYGSTINTSLSIATGKYYKLLDGDDWYNSAALEDFIEFLKKSNADVIVAPYYRVCGDEKSLYDNHQEIGKQEQSIETIELISAGFAMHELAVKTEKLRNFGRKITEGCFYTDVEFTCNTFISSDTIARFDEPVYCYRLGIDEQSVSINGLKKHYKDHPKVLNKVCQCYMENKDYIKGTKKRIIDYWIANLTRNTFISYLVLDEPLTKRKELISLNKTIKKQYPYLYKIGNESKLVRGIRLCRFKPYLQWCKFALNKITFK